MTSLRIGQGFDVHVFSQGRPLIIGGVTIPYVKGLHGHSDADVLTHAICDAILGAAGLRDIGFHFPDTDPSLAGVNSLKLLEKVVDLASEKGFTIVNVDATVILEWPKLQPHIENMRVRLGAVLSKSGGPAEVNIKAKTTEGVGFTGRGEGVAAEAVALLSRERSE